MSGAESLHEPSLVGAQIAPCLHGVGAIEK